MNFGKLFHFAAVFFLGTSLLWAGQRGKLEVVFLDVHGGNAALIRTPDNYTILIDAGDGVVPILPILKSKNIKRIDALVITSPDADNIGGITPLIEANMDIGEFFAPELDDSTVDFDTLLETIMMKQDAMASSGNKMQIEDAMNNKKHYEFQNVGAGTVFSWGSSISAVVLGPYRNYRNTSSDLHNNSLVIKITYGKHSFLFPGNVESKAERDLTKLGGKIQSTVLLIPNHASGNSVSDVFFHKVGALYAVYQPSKTAPSDSIFSVLKTMNSKIYNTKEKGNIVFTTDGLNMTVQTAK